jgi:hypothetical protein
VASVSHLLESGADPNGEEVWRSLRWGSMCAAYVGAASHVGSLPAAAPEPGRAADRSNPEGATPLHSAALGGCSRCAKALLEAGADRGLPDAEGRLPADLAPAGDARLADLLHLDPSAKASAKARSGAAGPLSPPKSAQEQFAELPQVG